VNRTYREFPARQSAGKAAYRPEHKPSYAQHQPVPNKNKPLRRAQTCCQTLTKGNRILRHFSGGSSPAAVRLKTLAPGFLPLFVRRSLSWPKFDLPAKAAGGRAQGSRVHSDAKVELTIAARGGVRVDEGDAERQRSGERAPPEFSGKRSASWAP
jgi:hypothetical protein